MDLDNDVKYVKGVGPNRALLLNRLGIYTLRDLITYYPRDYEDRSKPKLISELIDGEETLVKGFVASPMLELKVRRNLTICKLVIRDETGSCTITWYNQPYLKKIFKVGTEYSFYGKVSKKGNKPEINSPVFDVAETQKNTGKIVPIYPSTYKLSQNTIRQVIENGLNAVEGDIEETIPSYIREEYNLININNAIKNIHFPYEFSDFKKARTRLVFEELLGMQLALLNLKQEYTQDKVGIKFDPNIKISEVINNLPFKLTRAQLRVLEEIDNNMESEKTMNRLLQGDVGSGKTIVSIIAAYKAVKSGYQVAVMAPTAILASQHLESFTETLNQYGIKCELLVSSVTKKKKEEILERLQSGDIDILIGTHAILEDNVIFNKLRVSYNRWATQVWCKTKK